MTLLQDLQLNKPEHIIGDIWVQNLMNKMLTKLDDQLIKLKQKHNHLYHAGSYRHETKW